MKETTLLPIGSIVYLNGNLKKVMIIGRSMMKEHHGTHYYFDYTACLYPEGLVNDEVLFINEEDISDVLYDGYTDDDNTQLEKRILAWRQGANVKKGTLELFKTEA